MSALTLPSKGMLPNSLCAASLQLSPTINPIVPMVINYPHSINTHKLSPGIHKYSWDPQVATIKQWETGVGRVPAQLPKQSTRNDTILIQSHIGPRRKCLAVLSFVFGLLFRSRPAPKAYECTSNVIPNPQNSGRTRLAEVFSFLGD